MNELCNQPLIPDTLKMKHELAFEGLTLRDYFAAKALAALIAKHKSVVGVPPYPCPNENELQTARGAYAYADAMLAERSK